MKDVLLVVCHAQVESIQASRHERRQIAKAMKLWADCCELVISPKVVEEAVAALYLRLAAVQGEYRRLDVRAACRFAVVRAEEER
jgi:hypothetical protein